MGRKQRLLQNMADHMDLPTESLPGLPIAELWGEGRVLVEHHRGILQYSREQITVKVSYGQLRICGCNLEVTLMTRDQLLVSGRVDGVAVIRRGKC